MERRYERCVYDQKNQCSLQKVSINEMEMGMCEEAGITVSLKCN